MNSNDPAGSASVLMNTNEQYAMVGQTDAVDQIGDLELGHRHHDGPAPFETTAVVNDPNQHTHCAECDRQRERKERRESEQRACGLVSRTFILIFLFLMILGIVGIQAWKEVVMRKSHD